MTEIIGTLGEDAGAEEEEEEEEEEEDMTVLGHKEAVRSAVVVAAVAEVAEVHLHSSWPIH